MPENLRIELAPDPFIEPSACTLATGVQRSRVRELRELAYRHRAEAKVGRQVGRPLDRRIVAQLTVPVDAVLEFAKALLRGGGAWDQRQIRRHEAQRLERRQRRVERRGDRRERTPV